MSRLGRVLSAVLILGLLQPAAARAVDPQREARSRLSRGVKLVNDGDDAGAAAEFRRAFELSGDVRALYNLGLVYAAMNKPAQAVETLDQLLGAPGGLPPDRIARARSVRDTQATRLGHLQIVTNVPAQINLDNLEVGRTPLSRPIAVLAGQHLLSVVASGHEPLRRQVEVAGGQMRVEKIVLQSTATRLGELTVDNPVPGMEVWMDGKLVGRTPLGAPLPVTPGAHQISFRRPGYQTIDRDVQVGSGIRNEVRVEPQAAAPSVAAPLTQLKLSITEPGAEVTIDGQRQRLPPGGLPIPAGLHTLRVERSGFLPYQRQIELPERGPHQVQVTLEPTEETRYEHQQRASGQRLRAWVTLAVGAAATGAGFLWMGVAQREHSGAQTEYDEVAAMTRPMGQCYTGAGGGMIDRDACQTRIDRANDRMDQARTQLWASRGVAAVGLGVLATGVVLRLLAADPAKYETGDVQLIGLGTGLGLRGQF